MVVTGGLVWDLPPMFHLFWSQIPISDLLEPISHSSPDAPQAVKYEISHRNGFTKLCLVLWVVGTTTVWHHSASAVRCYGG